MNNYNGLYTDTDSVNYNDWKIKKISIILGDGMW